MAGKRRSFQNSDRRENRANDGPKSPKSNELLNVFVVRPGRFELPAPRLGGGFPIL